MKSLHTIYLALVSAACLSVSTVQAQLLWEAIYSGMADESDGGQVVKVDTEGHVYMLGFTHGLGTSIDYLTIKYDASGNQLWATRYNGPGNGQESPAAMVLDAFGNVYVTGSDMGLGTGHDYATIKYANDGTQLWVARYNGPGNSSDWALCLGLDSLGNVYVGGYSAGVGTASDYATIKYDPNGNQLWVARYNGPGNSSDYAFSLVVDPQGNAYVTGGSYGGVTSDDYATVKYNSVGQQLWVRRFNGPGNSEAIARTVRVDQAGNVYVTGSASAHYPTTGSDYTTIKYNSSGVQLWIAFYNSPNNGSDSPRAMAVDASGNVYVTGFSQSSFTTVKYNTNGDQLWVARYEGPENGSDGAEDIVVGADGNVYVTGFSDGVREWDYTTIKYSAVGNQLWIDRYDGGSNAADHPFSLAVDLNDIVYVTGQCSHLQTGVESNYNAVTIKYSPSFTAHDQPRQRAMSSVPEESEICDLQCFMSNCMVMIGYELKSPSQISLKIYDTAGRLVTTLVDGLTPAGTHGATFDGSGLASGIYLAKLQAGEFTAVQKLVLMK